MCEGVGNAKTGAVSIWAGGLVEKTPPRGDIPRIENYSFILRYSVLYIDYGMKKSKFLPDENGAVIMMAALMISVIAGAVAFSTEYSRAATARSQMQSAVDAAALSAMEVYHDTQDRDAAADRAEVVFRVNMRDDTDLLDVVHDLTVDAGDRVRVDVAARYDSIFRSVMPMAIDASATAAKSEEFLDVHLLLDRSASMLLAEEGPDMDDFKALTKPMLHASFPEADGGRLGDGEPEGCAFACHKREGWEADGKTAYQLASEAGIILRIHRVVEAAKEVLAVAYREANETTRIGIFDFAESTRTVVPATRDEGMLQTALDTPFTYPVGYTHYLQMTNHVTAALGPSGSGRSQESPRHLVVLITDGAYSRRLAGGDSYEILDPSHCDRLKDQGYTVAVLNTRYDPLDDSGRYDYLISPKAHLFKPALEACASPDLYFEVGSGEDMTGAFRRLARDIIPGPILRLVK